MEDCTICGMPATVRMPAPLAERGFLPRCDAHDPAKPPYADEIAASRRRRARGWPRLTPTERLRRAEQEVERLRAALAGDAPGRGEG